MANKFYMLVLISGLTLLSLTGCTLTKSNDNKNSTTEVVTEQPKIDKSVGFDTSDDVLISFSKIFSTDMTKEDISKHLYANIKEKDVIIDNIFNTITNMKSTIKFNSESIKYSSIDMDSKSLSTLGYDNASAVKTNRITILGETSTVTSDTNSLYSFDLYTVCIEDRWYITGLTVLDDTAVINQNVKIDLTTVDGTLENPAKLDQWVKTTIINPESNQEINVLVKITKILTGKKALNNIEKYKAEGNYDLELSNLGKDLEYGAFKYQVYCEDPSVFKSAPIINFSIHTTNDNEDIDKRLINTTDISNPNIDDFITNNVWKNGFVVFTKIKDTKDYLIQLNGQNNIISYINPIKDKSNENVENASTENTTE